MQPTVNAVVDPFPSQEAGPSSLPLPEMKAGEPRPYYTPPERPATPILEPLTPQKPAPVPACCPLAPVVQAGAWDNVDLALLFTAGALVGISLACAFSKPTVELIDFE